MVNLSWVSVPGATGYKVYYDDDGSGLPYRGTQAAQGASPVDVGNKTAATLTLAPGIYYATVTAYNANGENIHSNELSGTIQAKVYLPLVRR